MSDTTPAPVEQRHEDLFSELLRLGEFWPGHENAVKMRQAIATFDAQRTADLTADALEAAKGLAVALEPFSVALGSIADKDVERWPDNETIEHSGAAEEITWGDLRAARSALTAWTEAQP